MLWLHILQKPKAATSADGTFPVGSLSAKDCSGWVRTTVAKTGKVLFTRIFVRQTLELGGVLLVAENNDNA